MWIVFSRDEELYLEFMIINDPFPNPICTYSSYWSWSWPTLAECGYCCSPDTPTEFPDLPWNMKHEEDIENFAGNWPLLLLSLFLVDVVKFNRSSDWSHIRPGESLQFHGIPALAGGDLFPGIIQQNSISCPGNRGAGPA